MCEWKPDFDGLNERVTKIEGRMPQVEHDVGKMRSEPQEGFKAGAAQMNAINTSVDNLAHDFGERMNGFDKRLVTERADIYPDGWEYIDPASRRKALTPEEAAARAASRRTAKQARIDALQAQLDALREQLTVPATNDELIVSQAQARIRIASIQRTLDRLTAPTSTNEVVITVTPPNP